MEEELGRIEMIDNYLNGKMDEQELNRFHELLSRDQTLKEELEVFKQIYGNLDYWGDQRLKNRLQTYYHSYDEENSLRGEKKKKGRQLFLYLSAAVAASLLIGLVYFNLNETYESPDLASTKETDQRDASGDKVKGASEDQELSDQQRVLSLIEGTTRLPVDQVRSLYYPQPLKYSFSGNDLVIYGDPLIPQLGVELYKQVDRYYLRIKDKFYLVKRGAKKASLEPYTVKPSSTSGTEESLSIKIAGLSDMEAFETDIAVFLVHSDLPTKQYYFIQEDHLTLVLEGNFKPGYCRIFHVEGNQYAGYYLSYDRFNYYLDEAKTAATLLPQPMPLFSAENRLFRTDAAIEKPVYLIN
jgi:hypothetical protein